MTRLAPEQPQELALFPPGASDAAARVDLATAVLLVFTGVTILIVAGLVLWFGVRYRESRARSAPELKSRRIEIAWAAAIVASFLALFILGGRSFIVPRERPRSSETIYVVGKQWMWKVQHASGRREINELHLPLGRPVRLLLASQDVIHSFYVPAFRLKQDAVPGRYTALSFTPTRTGSFDLYCAEYCGSHHSRMTGRITVMPAHRFEAWLSGRADDTEPALEPMLLADEGARVFARLGCGACHTRTSTRLAPRLDGIFGRQTRTESGRLMVVDENYIRESILHPEAHIVAGYSHAPGMPSYQGQVSEEELRALIELIRSIRDGWPPDAGQDAGQDAGRDAGWPEQDPEQEDGP